MDVDEPTKTCQGDENDSASKPTRNGNCAKPVASNDRPDSVSSASTGDDENGHFDDEKPDDNLDPIQIEQILRMKALESLKKKNTTTTA